MPEALALSSFPAWHCWPPEGSVRRLGSAIRRSHPEWQDGGEYTKAQLDGYCWSDSRRVTARWDALADDAVFVCSLDSAFAWFELVDTEADPLVDAEGAQAAVLELRDVGWSLRKIAQASETSYDSVGRLASGSARRRVRASTEAALVALAAKANGKRPRGRR